MNAIRGAIATVKNNKEDIIKSNVKDDGDNSNNNDVSISEDSKNDS